MKEIIRYLSKLLMLMMLFPLKALKTRPNQILLDNCLAHNYADNIKPIAEELALRGEYIIYVSVLNEDSFSFLYEKGIRPVKFRSIKYYFVAMTSGFFITNSGGYSYLPLKKNQKVINTWHGGGAYKKIGIDAYNVSSFYRHELKLAANKTSVFLASSVKFADCMSHSLIIPRNRFVEVGMPRNDVLLNGNPDTIKSVRNEIGLKDNERMVLYAPTYRRINTDSFGESVAIDYGIDCNRVIEALSKRFGGEWRFAVRLHPQIKKAGSEFDDSRVLNLTSYGDMQELLLVADVMINDFSSSMWDYMLTGKPGFLYAKDLQNYINTTAVYTPVESWPFPKSTSNDELETAILQFDENEYREACDRHYNELGGCGTGKATSFVCDYISQCIAN